MRKRIVGMAIAAVVLASLPMACSLRGGGRSAEIAGRKNAGEKEQGALPVLKIANKWVYKGTISGFACTMTEMVIGEKIVDGIECYVKEVTFDPPVHGVIAAMSLIVEKSSLDILSGKSTKVEGDGITGMVLKSAYERSGSKYPLFVGKTWEVMEKNALTMSVADRTETRTRTARIRYEVEKMGEITVPAGTFSCFKILKYDEKGALDETRWVSEAVKFADVKFLDNKDGDTTELISYSVYP